MLVLRPPGVYRPQHDTWLLAEVLRRDREATGRRVLDLCTGTGALAVVAARAGAASITVVDVNRCALAAAWVNVALRGRRVSAHHGDLVDPVSNQRFDLVVSNPPYVPAGTSTYPPGARRGPGTRGLTGAHSWTGSARRHPKC